MNKIINNSNNIKIENKEINKKEVLNIYIIRFAITLLNRSENITNIIDIPNTNTNFLQNWEYIVNQFKTLNNDNHIIKKDILKLICHDNFKSTSNNFKGIDLRYLIAQKIIDECYIYL